ncbi:MAG TPA: hypothetical protein VEH48_00535 [Candidatus Nitrosopolaris sp.]|nr:hypothetical protein [Candidatus Nitrosopolaris sp.]
MSDAERIDTTGIRWPIVPYLNPEDHEEDLFAGKAQFDEHPEMRELIDLGLDLLTAIMDGREGLNDLDRRYRERAIELCAELGIEDPDSWSLAASLAASHIWNEHIAGGLRGSHVE